MYTYQDLLDAGTDEKKRKDFVLSLINEHKSSLEYKTARDAYEYYRHRNVTINEYQKLLYKVTGEVVPDNYSANYKMACRHFHRFITQEVQYLLGNGISWGKSETEKRLSTKRKPIDRQVKDAATKALWGRAAFGFYAKDHVEVFNYLEFAPLLDETDGLIKAGARFWQIAPNKPLRATLYEIDGLTKYVWDNTNKNSTLFDEPKRSYKYHIAHTDADGDEIYSEENYPTFPIIPLWANSEHQSVLVGLREQIDCYDLIKSGFANTVDEASLFYWTIQNAGGMDDLDLAKFVHHMKTVHAATVDEDGASAEAHTLDVPYASREALLDRLDADLYRDAMALNTDKLLEGTGRSDQIRAAYENLNAKCDDFEYQVLDFIQGILAVAGIDDEAAFTRSQIVNKEETISLILQASQYLSQEYVTKKILDLIGDGDLAENVLNQMDEEGRDRFQSQELAIDESITEEVIEE